MNQTIPELIADFRRRSTDASACGMANIDRVWALTADKLELAYTGTFAWAMDKLLTVPGAKVRRKGWPEFVPPLILLPGRKVQYGHRKTGAGMDYDLPRDDLTATDWGLVEEPKP